MVDSRASSPTSDWDLKRPRPDEDSELTALKARVAALEERLEERRKDEPWWRSARTVTLIASLLAAFVPLTSALEAYFKGQSDLALASEQQRHAMRMDYMRTALDPAAPEMQRQSRLRLLMAILPGDDPVRDWAAAELDMVNSAVKQLKQELQTAQQQLAATQVEEQEVNTHLSELQARLPQALPGEPATGQPAGEAQIKRELATARDTLQQVQARKTQLRERAKATSAKLLGPAASAPL